MSSYNHIPEERRATAPYNFIPLTKDIKKLNSPLPDHNSYDPNLLSGYMEVQLTTKSLLFIRTMLSSDEYAKSLEMDQYAENYNYDQNPKNKPKFFYTNKDERPVIPASSLRGMVRNMLEIITESKIDRVYDRGLFFRTVDPSSLGAEAYRPRMTKEHNGKEEDLVKSGFLIMHEREYYIKPCKNLKVERDKLNSDTTGNGLYEGKAPNQTPKWEGEWHQYQKIWVKHGNKSENTSPYKVVEINKEEHKNLLEGRLILTGQVPKKNHERVFLKPEDKQEEWIKVDSEIIDLFNGDQMTAYQEKAFPIDKPTVKCRIKPGFLQTAPADWGEPVFYLQEIDPQTKATKLFLGRARMFRLPYHASPKNLLPVNLKDLSATDLTDALFGYIDQKKIDEHLEGNTDGSKPIRGRASRITFTDATLPPDVKREEVLTSNPITSCLESPKPTAFQQYLVQPFYNDRQLHHYASKDAELRGHKLYWHQGKSFPKEANADEIRKAQRRCTRLWPVKEGITFLFKVFFENLTSIELGALIWALQPDGDRNTSYCHKLGMGKPLGLGSVHLQTTLHLRNLKQRYESLFNTSGNWETGYETESYPLYDADERLNWINDFEAFMSNGKPFAQTERIQSLLRIMQFPGIADKQQIEYLAISKNLTGKPSFKDRPVLPNALSPDIVLEKPDLPPSTLPYIPKSIPSTTPIKTKPDNKVEEFVLECKISNPKYGKLKVTSTGRFNKKELTCNKIKQQPNKYKKNDNVTVRVQVTNNKINNPDNCELVSP
ncbi:MAG TPA: TIGR03986 family CRISPR-associated RAMP protein [Rhodothermales bacterium]|nr:TIGR03986 family CRISPR-associated RAMP protein [Rhodothermales bacterium]